MLKLATFVFLIGISGLATSIAVSSIVTDHDHRGGQTVGHDASLDVHGCHIGPTGYHCH